MKIKVFSTIPFLKGPRIIIRGLDKNDYPGLKTLVDSREVYRYLPTFLYEKQYDDIYYIIDHLYNECLKESMILGVFTDNRFCGLAEMYGLNDHIHKISIGYRFLKDFWGQGIATEALGIMINYLYNETDIEIITASTMVENIASATVLRKNGFDLVVHAAYEDWGYDKPTVTDKWIR